MPTIAVDIEDVATYGRKPKPVVSTLTMAPGPVMLDLTGETLTDEETVLLRNPRVGGVILFARNVRDRKQVAELTAAIRALRPDLLLSVDQEGGRVQRLKKGYTSLPCMQRLGDYYQAHRAAGAELIKDCGWLMAVEVIASGLDFSFAPVMDLDRNHCAVIADRAFSDAPQLATEAARLFIAGMHEAGMASTGKHFPGHGGVTADSHLETPRDERDLDAIRHRDLLPFQTLSGELDAVMPAHILFPRIDSQAVGFSSFWLQQILRAELGFQGVIFSDDLVMEGATVGGTFGERATRALAAGCDMVLVCNHRQAALEVLETVAAMAVQPSPRLATMKARRQWSWTELETNPRYLSTRQKLRESTDAANT